MRVHEVVGFSQFGCFAVFAIASSMSCGRGMHNTEAIKTALLANSPLWAIGYVGILAFWTYGRYYAGAMTVFLGMFIAFVIGLT